MRAVAPTQKVLHKTVFILGIIMSKSILEVVNGMEYIDERLKLLINKVFDDNADTCEAEIVEFVLTSHKETIEQLGNSYSALVYDNIRNLERMGRWTSLSYIARAAQASRITALQNVSKEDCELTRVLTKSYELEREFSDLGLEDKQRVMNIYNNE